MAASITSNDVLSFFGLSNPPYSAERISTTTSKNKYASAKNKSEHDDQEWVIYKTDSKTKSKEKYSLSQFTSNNPTFNACSITGEQGIIIVNKKNFIDNKSKGSSGTNSLATTETTESSSNSLSIMGSDGATAQGWYEATDYNPKGHDEKIVQNIQFIKSNLIKECFEWVGINLSTKNFGTHFKTDYWD